MAENKVRKIVSLSTDTPTAARHTMVGDKPIYCCQRLGYDHSRWLKLEVCALLAQVLAVDFMDRKPGQSAFGVMGIVNHATGYPFVGLGLVRLSRRCLYSLTSWFQAQAGWSDPLCLEDMS